MPRFYTLEEAKLALDREECAINGHDYDVTGTLDGPARVLCARCGRSWRVQNPNPVKTSTGGRRA